MGEETPDRYIPDNLDEIMQRVYEHGIVQRKHHIQQGMSEQEYLQTTRDTITSPSIIAELQQRPESMNIRMPHPYDAPSYLYANAPVEGDKQNIAPCDSGR